MSRSLAKRTTASTVPGKAAQDDRHVEASVAHQVLRREIVPHLVVLGPDRAGQQLAALG